MTPRHRADEFRRFLNLIDKSVPRELDVHVVANWNDDPKPFVWHKTADEILDSLAAYCRRINASGH